jgi:hypothetical protein
VAHYGRGTFSKPLTQASSGALCFRLSSREIRPLRGATRPPCRPVSSPCLMVFLCFLGSPKIFVGLGGHAGCPPRRGPLLRFVAVFFRLALVLPSPRAGVASIPSSHPRRAYEMTTAPRPATTEGLESTRHRGPPQPLHAASGRSSAGLAARSLGAAYRSHVPSVRACENASRLRAGLTSR